MYAVANVAKAVQVKGVNPVGIRAFFELYAKEFADGCFVFEGVKREIPRGAVLAKVSAGNLSMTNRPYEYFYEYDNTIKIRDCLVLPFGVLKTHDQKHVVKSLLTGCYVGDFNGKMPNDEMNCTVLFALMQNVIYELARMDRTLSQADTRYHFKVLLTLYYFTKTFMNDSADVREMVHSLAQCSESKDVLQCELATIIDGQKMTPAFFQRILSLAFARQMKRYGKNEWSRVTLDRYSGMNALFDVTPILTHTTTCDVANIEKCMQLHTSCVKCFDTRKPDLSADNSEFQVSADICHVLVGNMIYILKVAINHPEPKFFQNLFMEIASKNFNFSRVSEKSAVQHTPVEIPLDKEGHLSKPITIVNGKFVSPTVTDWGTTCFTMGLDTTYIINIGTLTTANVVAGDTRKVYGTVANVVFLGHGDRAVQLCFNTNGSYSPMTNQKYDPLVGRYVSAVPTQFPIKMRCAKDGITITGSDGNVRYHVHGQKIVMAVKNVEVTITQDSIENRVD
jgi:hypothetical protein